MVSPVVVSVSGLHKLVGLFLVASTPTAALVLYVRTTDAIDSKRQLQYHVFSVVWLYNHARYHESLDNVTPADMYFGRYHEIMGRRAQTKQQTLQLRRVQNLNSVPDINQAI
jgi:hypothetical protein